MEQQGLMGLERLENWQTVVSSPARLDPDCSGQEETLITGGSTQKWKHFCAVKGHTYDFHWRAVSCKLCILAILSSFLTNKNAFLQKSMTQGKVCLLSEWFGKAEEDAAGEFLAQIYSVETTACNGSWEIFRKFESRLCDIVLLSSDVWTVFTSQQEGRGWMAEEGVSGIHTLRFQWPVLCFGTGEDGGWGKDTACTSEK